MVKFDREESELLLVALLTLDYYTVEGNDGSINEEDRSYLYKLIGKISNQFPGILEDVLEDMDEDDGDNQDIISIFDN